MDICRFLFGSAFLVVGVIGLAQAVAEHPDTELAVVSILSLTFASLLFTLRGKGG